MTRAQEYQDHIDELCTEHAIEFVETNGLNAAANIQQRRVKASPPTGVERYFIVLHEIGHVVCGLSPDGNVVEEEMAAWRWALDIAIQPPTQGVARAIFNKLVNYAIHEGRAHAASDDPPARKMIPSPDDPFWLFLEGLVSQSSRATYQTVKLASLAR